MSPQGNACLYLYERMTSTWVQVDKPSASDRQEYDSFGSSVDIDGDLVIVGAFAASAAYIFERQPNGSFIETAKMTDPSIPLWLDRDVAIEGDWAFACCPLQTGHVVTDQRQAGG
ncbi:MAG: hypothetical protein ACI835_000002 [Planctomycetota bacterium]